MADQNSAENERFRIRSLVYEEDDHTTETAALTPKQKLQRATRKCIAANRLKNILKETADRASSSANKVERTHETTNIMDLPREHHRNAGQYTVVAFLNANSGGGIGKLIFDDLVQHLGADYVFDLSKCSVGNMPEDNLRQYSNDPSVRVLACGLD